MHFTFYESHNCPVFRVTTNAYVRKGIFVGCKCNRYALPELWEISYQCSVIIIVMGRDFFLFFTYEPIKISVVDIYIYFYNFSSLNCCCFVGFLHACLLFLVSFACFVFVFIRYSLPKKFDLSI